MAGYLSAAADAVFTFRAPASLPTKPIADNKDIEDLIPDFAARNIVDPVLIREELRRGPSVSIIVGPTKVIFTLPKRLLLYHSTTAQQIFANEHATGSAGEGVIKLPTYNAEAFAKLQSWFVEGTFHGTKLTSQMANSSPTSMQAGVEAACTLLCYIWFLASKLGVPAVKQEITESLTAALNLARDLRHPTPFVPETVMEVWECCGEDSRLWKIVLESLRRSSTRAPLLDVGEYEECFAEIGVLEEVLEDGVVGGIFEGWQRLAQAEVLGTGLSPVEAGEDEGRPAGWWKGPF